MPRLRSGAGTDRPEVIHLTLPPIPEVVWQQPQETHLTTLHNDLTNETQKDTHTPKQKNDVEAQTSAKRKRHPKYPDPTRKCFWRPKLGAYQYCAQMTPRNSKMKSNEMKWV